LNVNETRLIVDAWAQPATREAAEKMPEVLRLLKQSGSAEIFRTGLTTEQLVESMDRAGVQKLMLSAWRRPGQWIHHNDDVAKMVSQYPDRFAGVAAVNLEKPVEAVRELERAVKELGFKALRVVPWLWNRPPNDKFYFPLFPSCRLRSVLNKSGS
jgi:predicted TIM-barrel fold metal-dependent hydrolase